MPLGVFALIDNPNLGIKVIDVREADEYEIAKVDGVPLLPSSQIESRWHYSRRIRRAEATDEPARADARPTKLRQPGFKYLKSVKGGSTALRVGAAFIHFHFRTQDSA